MKSFEIDVALQVKVTVDETKFTPEFMAEFRLSISPFYELREHVEHLGQLFARGVVDNSTKFIEGYGPPSEMGIRFEELPGSWSTVLREEDL